MTALFKLAHGVSPHPQNQLIKCLALDGAMISGRLYRVTNIILYGNELNKGWGTMKTILINGVMLIESDGLHNKWIQDTGRLDHDTYVLTKVAYFLGGW